MMAKENKTIEDLQKEKVSLERKLNDVKYNVTIQKEKDYSQISKLKKEIARVNTVISETRREH